MKKYAVAGILACALFAAPSFAQVVVRIGPPPVVVERPGPPPRAGYVWVPGYHRWDGARYVWVPGRYAYPPRPRAVWVPGRWDHRHDGWVYREGRWR
jgi:YXWGXW repeat-containing protein